jgi:hypothetical protein
LIFFSNSFFIITLSSDCLAVLFTNVDARHPVPDSGPLEKFLVHLARPQTISGMQPWNALRTVADFRLVEPDESSERDARATLALTTAYRSGPDPPCRNREIVKRELNRGIQDGSNVGQVR